MTPTKYSAESSSIFRVFEPDGVTTGFAATPQPAETGPTTRGTFRPGADAGASPAASRHTSASKGKRRQTPMTASSSFSYDVARKRNTVPLGNGGTTERTMRPV